MYKGRIKIFFFVCILNQLIITNLYSDEKKTNERFAELNILDKVSSKSSSIKIEIGKDLKFQNLLIKVLKCYNSEFDDDPEVTAYMQVKDLIIKIKYSSLMIGHLLLVLQ